jgi:hypothetical protein
MPSKPAMRPRHAGPGPFLACAAMLVACTPAPSPDSHRTSQPARPGAAAGRPPASPAGPGNGASQPESGGEPAAEPGSDALRPPLAVDLGNGMRLVPRTQRLIRPDCRIELAWPELAGHPSRAVQEQLNAHWSRRGQLPRDEDPCGESEDQQYEESWTYAVGAHRAGHLGLASFHFVYDGGAHGHYMTLCAVYDLRSGQKKDLRTLVDPSRRTALAALIKRELARDNNVTRLSEAGFFQDTIDLTDSGYQLCLNEDGVEVVFPLYEIAPYGMGEPKAYLTSAQIAPLLIANPTTKALFGGP